MQVIYYIGGCSAQDNLSAVAIGLTTHPDTMLANLQAIAPFHHLTLLAVEQGSQERLDAIKKEFEASALAGPWFKYTEELEKLVKSLPNTSFKSRRVSLDLDPEDWLMLETMVEEFGEKKSKVLRRALKFYRTLRKYKDQGYAIQAVKGGEVIRFPTLDDICGP